MPAWIWITSAAAVAFIVWAAFVRRWWHSLWYSWRRAAHVVELGEDEAVPGQEFYGSMTLADDLGFLPAPPVDPDPWLTRRVPRGVGVNAQLWEPDWREQTAADLSPEALEHGPARIEYRYEDREMFGSPEDTGPGGGDSSLAASPGPARSDWLENQMEILFAWVRAQHEVTA